MLRNSCHEVLFESLVNRLYPFPVVQDLHQQSQGELCWTAPGISPTETVWTVIHQIVSWIEKAYVAVTHHEDLLIRKIRVSVFFSPPRRIAQKCDIAMNLGLCRRVLPLRITESVGKNVIYEI